MASLIFALIGWSYLPDFATRQILPYYLRFYQTVLRRPIPPPNTPQFAQHYRYVYSAVVLSYLFYNFRAAALSMSPNFYEILGVYPTADDSALKTAFRQFAKKNHPDRVGPQGESLFMEVRDAYDALKNPITRFAYDRFGPEALHWKHCATLREYIRHGLIQSVGFHAVSVCALLLFTAVGRPSPVAFWRFVLLASLIAYELLFLLGPSPSTPSNSPISSLVFSDPASPSHTTIFSWLWPERVAYQHIRFLHSLFMLLGVALSRVAPVLFPPPPDAAADAQRLISDLGKIHALASSADQEVAAMVQIELHSVHGEPTGVPASGATFPYISPLSSPADEVMSLLTSEMENMVIEGKILREGGPMKSMVDTVVQRHKQDMFFDGYNSGGSGGFRNSSPIRGGPGGMGGQVVFDDQSPASSPASSPMMKRMAYSVPVRGPTPYSSPSRRVTRVVQRRPYGSPVRNEVTETYTRGRSSSL